jgi:hypothetical protein
MGSKISIWFFEAKQHRFATHLLLSAMSMALFAISVAIITASDFNPFIYFRF